MRATGALLWNPLQLNLGVSRTTRDASKMDEQNPDITEMVNATGDAVFHSPAHVREHEARIANLSPCALAPIDECEPTRATLAGFSFELRIPNLAAAEPIEAPDDRWYGRQWAPGEFLLFHVDPNPEFAVITPPGPTACRLDLAGRPMKLRRIAPGDLGWAANAYAAEVIGFLDDATHFWGQVVSPTETRRESLLAALATIERVSE